MTPMTNQNTGTEQWLTYIYLQNYNLLLFFLHTYHCCYKDESKHKWFNFLPEPKRNVTTKLHVPIIMCYWNLIKLNFFIEWVDFFEQFSWQLSDHTCIDNKGIINLRRLMTTYSAELAYWRLQHQTVCRYPGPWFPAPYIAWRLLPWKHRWSSGTSVW